MNTSVALALSRAFFEDSTIDDLMRLIEDGPGVGPCRRSSDSREGPHVAPITVCARDQDVDELLKSLQPKEGQSPVTHARTWVACKLCFCHS